MTLGGAGSDSGGGGFSRDGGGADVNGNYPHPFFGISDKYIPTTQKEMYRWVQYVYTINPIFSRVINKMAGYVTTDLIYDIEDPPAEKFWRTMLEKTIGYKLMEKLALLDLLSFGNSYIRFMYPKQRMLICPNCGQRYPINNIDYTFSGFRFRGRCTACSYSGVLKAEDKPTRNRTKIKLIRLDPRYVQPIHEPISGATEYMYSVPKSLANLLREGANRKTKLEVILENIPLEVIEAVEKGYLIKFPADSIYHLKWHSISRDDNSLGDIPFLPVFKVIWLYHTLWRAQEAVSLEHTLPWTFLSPAATSGGQEPIMNYDLAGWNQFMRETLMRMRRDPNYIAMTPFPVQEVNLRGDAKALDNWQGLEHLKEAIATGMGIPPSFLFGGATYSSASVELRVLENDFKNILLQLDDMLEDFVVPKIARYFSVKKEEIYHEDFKMADDIQQRQLAVALFDKGVISEEKLSIDLGYDPEEERVKRDEELRHKMKVQREMMIAEAEAQAEITKIQAKAQYEANQIMQTGQDPSEEPEQEEAQFGNSNRTFTNNPDILKMQVQRFLQTRTPLQRQRELETIRATNPEYARSIEKSMAETDSRMAAIKPLPVQKPGKQGPARQAI